MNDDVELQALFERAAGPVDETGAYSRLQGRIGKAKRRRAAAWTGATGCVAALIVGGLALRQRDDSVHVAGSSTTSSAVGSTSEPASNESTAASTGADSTNSTERISRSECTRVEAGLRITYDAVEIVEAEPEHDGRIVESSRTRVVMKAGEGDSCVIVAAWADGTVSFITTEEAPPTTSASPMPVTGSDAPPVVVPPSGSDDGDDSGDGGGDGSPEPTETTRPPRLTRPPKPPSTTRPPKPPTTTRPPAPTTTDDSDDDSDDTVDDSDDTVDDSDDTVDDSDDSEPDDTVDDDRSGRDDGDDADDSDDSSGQGSSGGDGD